MDQQLSVIRKRLAAGAEVAAAIQPIPHLFVEELAQLHQSVRNDVLGVGPTLTPLLNDPEVTDVLVNGSGEVWYDRGGSHGLQRLPEVDEQLKTEQGVRALAVRLAASCGQRLDDAAPIVDGTFPSGVRFHAVIPPLSAEGTLISLRTHRQRKLSLQDLVKSKSVHSDLVLIFQKLVECEANVMISGATGAGKTTFLNAMLQLVPQTQRILVIEESAELKPEHPHLLHLQVRRANVQGAGEVSMSELLRAAMRMRPDRIVLGECRGAEVRDVLSALNTGHQGGWATIHANSAADIPARLTALGALAGMNEETMAAQAASALDAVIHLQRGVQGRYVSEIGVLERQGKELVVSNVCRVSDDGQLLVGEAAGKLLYRLGLPESLLLSAGGVDEKW